MKYPIRVINELGSPVRGATVSSKGYTATTDGNGYALITAPKFNPDTMELTVTHEKYHTRTVLYSELKEAAGSMTIQAA